MQGVKTYFLKSQIRYHWKIGKPYDGFTNNDRHTRYEEPLQYSAGRYPFIALDGTHAFLLNSLLASEEDR